MNKKGSIASVFIILLAAITFIKIRQYNILTLEQLNIHKHSLMGFVEENYIFAALIFIATYIIFSALMLPGAVILSFAGGLLFGVLRGSLYVTVGATIGALCAFLVTRYFFGNTLQKKYAKSLKTFNDAFKQYGPLYLFTIRLFPIFPFFLVNLLAGLTNISTAAFIWTTFLGILPPVFGLTYLGAQLRYTDTVEDLFSYPLVIAGILIVSLVVIQTIASHRKKAMLSNRTSDARKLSSEPTDFL